MAKAVAGKAEALLGAAFRLAKDEGLNRLSSRRLTQAAGMSLSAVSYYFGNMAGVRRAVAAQTHQALSDWRSQRKPREGLANETATGFVLSVIADFTGASRGLALLEIELLNSDLADYFLSLEAGARAFWMARLADLGETEESATSWLDFLFGLKSLAVVDRDPASLYSWVPMLVQRFADRIAGRPATVTDTLLFPTPENFLTEPPPTRGSRRILDATIDLISEEGVDGVSHRKVAAKAGLSVASCQFFFGTRSAMIRAAVLDLERRMYQALVERLGTLGNGEPLLISNIERNKNFTALNSLHAPVARDPELWPVARVLRDFRGAHAWERLKSRYPEADRIDAIIWSTSFIGAMHPQRLETPRTNEALQRRLALHLNNLFLHKGRTGS